MNSKMQRRDLLKNSLIVSTSLIGLSAVAQTADSCLITKTPRQPEGPFYPVIDQVDKDSDLIQVTGSTAKAVGEIVLVEGVVLDQNCQPVSGALVEIWQACHTGRYNHPSDPNPAALDPHFQYWGKAITNNSGEYRFRTIVPGAYPAGQGWIRPPHIHFKVAKVGYVELITQMYFAGQSLNEKDLILSRLKKEDQHKVIVNFKNDPQWPHPVGRFDISLEKIM